jgi:hypothetical protein
MHQRARWLRHDAHLWIRNDAARWLKPGTDPADVYPTLKRQREAAEDAAFAAKIAASRRLLAALRAEVDELKGALARRRLEESKYSPTQPRVPAGNPRGGQWTDRSGGQSQDQTRAPGSRSRWAMSTSATLAGRANSAICSRLHRPSRTPSGCRPRDDPSTC